MTERSAFAIATASRDADLGDAAALFRDYTAWLDVDLSFQGFDRELATLPGKYAPPSGALLIARTPSGAAIGCVAMRPLAAAGTCELKRLYVRPEGRGLQLGRALVDAIIVAARGCGHRAMLLDTLPQMKAARAIYLEAGFRPTPAYYETPLPGTIFMAKDLVTEDPAG